jgi:hypothetical protein
VSRGCTCCSTWSPVANPTSVARVAPKSVGSHQLDLYTVSAKAVSTCCPPSIHTFIPSRGSLWVEACSEGYSHVQSPLHSQCITTPPPAPNTTPHGAGGAIGFKSPASQPGTPAPCSPATCIVYPHCASSPPLTVLPAYEHEQRSIHGNRSHAASQVTYPRVCSASRLHQHRRVWEVSRRTRVSS